MPRETDRDKPSKTPQAGASRIFDELDGQILPDHGRHDEEGLDDLRRSYGIIETLLEVSTSFTSTLDLEVLLQNIVDAVVRITDCDRGYLVLREDDGDLSFALARSRDGEQLSDESFQVSRSVIDLVASTGRPQVVTNAQEDADLREQRSIVDLDIRTVICIPLKFQDNLVGVIYADSGSVSETFSPSDISIMNAFGAQAAIAIENAKRHGELELIRNSLENQNLSLRHELAEKYEFSGMVGRTKSMRQIFEIIGKVAPLSTTVLVQGETGTGKELIAKAIHYNGPRRDRPIVSINCGALPKDILESELFGYRRGAFTGADQDRAGLFEAADGGTLFLDEIGEMPVELQVKLLRALQEGEVRRLGEDKSRPVDVRVISATNKNLSAEVERGNFRNDLYYRLNVVPISLPPLRDRQADILSLAEFFVDKYAEAMGRKKPVLATAVKELLLQHTWPGNVRELENAIERALALGEGKSIIDIGQFDYLVHQSGGQDTDYGEEISLKSMLLRWEKDFIRKMLIKNSWNVSKTANELKISRQQLHNKIRKFELNQKQ